ncbi:hypothetical protein [Nocardioides ferulae]|uniref:hypothetical protein n=1 Tax=Nocardioides ferulae TaxID=2340821 RepID=UPI000EAB7C54|nr:hypothetical protein [Nocardioides ferulae]
MYSVLGASTIGFDLARLAGGAQTATVLRTALAADSDLLLRLAARHPGDEVRETWRRARDEAVASGRSRLGELLPRAGEALVEASHGEVKLLRRLEQSPLGDVAALDRLVRSELLDWTWLHSGPLAVQDPQASLAADVLADAAAAAFLRGVLPDDVRRPMTVPFLAVAGSDPVPETGTGLPEVDRRLGVLADSDSEVRQAWRRVVDEQRVHTAAWAPAMHQATWALSISERLRPSCDAQLAAVGAFSKAGFTGRDAAYGVWNALSGVLAASAVDDLLSAAEADALLRPWRAVYGCD